MGFAGISLRLFIKKVEILAILRKELPGLTIVKNTGAGILAYNGLTNAEDTVFIGNNPKLETSIIVFKGYSGLKVFDSLKKNFLDLEKNKEIWNDLTVCGVDATFVTLPPNNVKTFNDLTNCFEVAQQIQQKSLPKVMIDKSILYIGGKGSAANVSISGQLSNDMTIEFICVSLKLKDKSCSKLSGSLIASVDVPAENIVANAILSQMNRVSSNSFLDYVRTSIVKQYDVSKIVAVEQKETRSTTTSGKYIIRALSGVRNKMTDEKTKSEAITLFTTWFRELGTATKTHNKPIILSDEQKAQLNILPSESKTGEKDQGGGKK